MTTLVEVRPGAYADSVALLQVSREVAAADGVEAAQVAMATPLNVDTLAQMGFDVPACTANDMVVALRLVDGGDLDVALAAVATALAAASRPPRSDGEATEPPRTTGSALRRDDDARLALVSVPGEHAFVEAMDVVDAGRDVMIFSDNVPVEQEVLLKRAADRADVLVMGPDCGTAMVQGVGLGFANAVAPGGVGIVAASGTGCQQVMSLLDQAGVGVRAALGVGGRDLSDAVGGSSTRAALRRLDADPAPDVVVVVSKPPAPRVAHELEELTASLQTPVELVLLGPGRPDLTAGVERVLARVGRGVPAWATWGPDQRAGGALLRGLFVGGTLCDEAMLVVGDVLGPVRSNIPLEPDLALGPDLEADGHVMIDFGDDALTVGRAHPMIDPTLRLEHLRRVAADPRVGVVLLDVVLGHGAEPDPAALLAPAVEAARRTAAGDGRDLAVVVACVGTTRDPQDLDRQATALAAAGARVHASAAEAARAAAALVRTREGADR